ncbi:MAG: hypothetical protein KDJ29_10825, partial [Hyphomicrobiales bacterium]|nr:hypothetical protein [Hyphomicrobiales bacterium]
YTTPWDTILSRHAGSHVPFPQYAFPHPVPSGIDGLGNLDSGNDRQPRQITEVLLLQILLFVQPQKVSI